MAPITKAKTGTHAGSGALNAALSVSKIVIAFGRAVETTRIILAMAGMALAWLGSAIAERRGFAVWKQKDFYLDEKTRCFSAGSSH
jgi:hypothetical protein